MRSLQIDQFEFDDPGSEEHLEIDFCRQSSFPHSNVSAFVGSVVGVEAASALGDPTPFFRIAHRSQIGEYVKRFTNIDIPLHAEWPTYPLAAESWDEIHLVICGPDFFIRYHWSTSA